MLRPRPSDAFGSLPREFASEHVRDDEGKDEARRGEARTRHEDTRTQGEDTHEARNGNSGVKW
ncbi:hypothetical protein E2C01_096648 [Portunus trituberculatus]|uniref:Uncharacterized protein n=1 Tax=Portunus trituberculatus TaxID=210409 RepID=A0A5B7JYG7_PORTR|nr:hypothetical protein [Portunus trituberculatus]